MKSLNEILDAFSRSKTNQYFQERVIYIENTKK